MPEAYRQKFRSHVKNVSQTYVEYAREKNVLLISGVTTSSRVVDFDQLCELISIED